MAALRILLIEPDRYARDLLRLLVEAAYAYAGVVVTTARTAADGMDMFEATPFVIVICDYTLEAAALKELCDESGCSVVFMIPDTRLKPSDLQPLHSGLPTQSLLYKPLMFQDFCQKLHKAVLVARSTQLRSLPP